MQCPSRPRRDRRFFFARLRVERVLEDAAKEPVVQPGGGLERIDRDAVTESEPGRVAFRVRSADNDCNCGTRWDGFSVEYDIEIRVPRGAALDVATVNDGDVTVEGVNGDFELANVNGEIHATGLTGSGEIRTVNGNVAVAFARAPDAATSFHTVNGDLDVTFPNDLSADLQFKTMNGDVFTDFDVVEEQSPPSVEREPSPRGPRVRMQRNTRYAIGGGGPDIQLRTFNGDIMIRKR